MFNKKEKIILALMSIVQFCLIVDFMIVMPLGPQLMRLFDISASQFGSLVSTYTFGAGFMGFAASFLMDRWDRKRSLAVFFLGFAFGNLACALSPTYGILLAARFLTGAFGGVVGSIVYAIISDSIDIERRALALGIVMSSFALASILGVPVCLVLANHYGWHAPFVFLTVVSVLVSGSLAIWLVPMREHLTGDRHTITESFVRIKSLILDKNRALALVFMCVLILGHFSIIPFLFPSIVSNGGIAEAKLPVIYLVGGTASIFSSIFFGKIADRFGKKRIFVIAAILSAIPIYWVTTLNEASLLQATLVVTSFFIIMGGRLTPAMTLITSTCVPKNRGSFLSLVGSVQQLSAAVAAALAGMIVVKTDAGKLLNFSKVGFMAIGFSAIAILIGRMITPVEGENT